MELANFIHPRLQTFNNIRDFIFYMCRSGSDFNASKAAVLMWFIWQNRNNKVWNDSILSAQQIGVQALTYWNQWATINGLIQEQQQPALQPTAAAATNNSVQWIQPPFGFLKCNVDASFFNTAGATGCGWI
jgi:hypothetical protein